MTSLRKLYANRRNAQRCTGPKTAAGKARSARNASRHGLTRPARADPAWARMIAALAKSIVSDMGGAKGWRFLPRPRRAGRGGARRAHPGTAGAPRAL